jgi:hypothetical protein
MYSARCVAQFLFCLGAAAASPVFAQLQTDTLFTWRGYAQHGRCRLRVYAPALTLDRQAVIVIQEIAENEGPSTVYDIAYLAEEVGRSFALAPDSVHWIVHWGAFSFEATTAQRGKEVFLRATFKRTTKGHLGAPQWRVISREEVREYTDRAFW